MSKLEGENHPYCSNHDKILDSDLLLSLIGKDASASVFLTYLEILE